METDVNSMLRHDLLGRREVSVMAELIFTPFHSTDQFFIKY